jgi:hypothetical protein
MKLMNQVIAVLVVISISSTSPHAAEEWTDGDSGLAFLVGLLGLGAGSVGGMFIGFEAAGECKGDDSLFGPCFLHGFEEGIIGAYIGSFVLVPISVYIYGEASGHDGSFLATLVGSTPGMAVAAGVWVLAGDEVDSLGWLISLGMIASVIGSVVGYRLSVDSVVEDEPRTAALLNYEPGRGLSVGIPAVGTSITGHGLDVTVTLLGIKF